MTVRFHLQKILKARAIAKNAIAHTSNSLLMQALTIKRLSRHKISASRKCFSPPFFGLRGVVLLRLIFLGHEKILVGTLTVFRATMKRQTPIYKSPFFRISGVCPKHARKIFDCKEERVEIFCVLFAKNTTRSLQLKKSFGVFDFWKNGMAANRKKRLATVLFFCF